MMRALTLISIFSLSYLLVGCFRVGPDFYPPNVITQESWTEDARIFEADIPLGNWWEAFCDCTLNEMVQFALEEDYQDVRRLLISDLVLNFVQHKTIQKRIATLDRNIEIQHRSVEIALVRWKGGYESELDYSQAKALWKETSAQKINLEIELK